VLTVVPILWAGAYPLSCRRHIPVYTSPSPLFLSFPLPSLSYHFPFPRSPFSVPVFSPFAAAMVLWQRWSSLSGSGRSRRAKSV